MATLWNRMREIFPPAPTFTEKDLPDLSGSVYLITGGTGGIGLELAKLLYSKNGTVFLAGRSSENGKKAISSLQSLYPSSTGRLEFLSLDLSDLTKIKSSAEDFQSRTTRLDVVWHNAGVMIPPFGSKSAQGYELHLGTNVLAPFLFQQFLSPLQERTAALADTPKNSVRSVWLGSYGIHLSPPEGGVVWDDLSHSKNKSSTSNYLEARQTAYAQSKVMNMYIAKEGAVRHKDSGVLWVALNPGNLRTDLLRHAPTPLKLFIQWFMLYPAYYGGLTELFGGLSPEIDETKNGAYLIPWGRFGDHVLRKDIQKALAEGNGKRVWEWCETECKPYM